MKNSMKIIVRIFMLCFVLSFSGNVSAGPPHFQHPPRTHKYYYYPKQNVYYDPIENVYFVWERSYWKPVSYTPGRYVSITSNSPRFELWIASAHPYYYNVEHRRTYHVYRIPAPAPVSRARVVARRPNPNPNVSFHLEINSVPEPRPVYVEERVVIVKEPHGHGHGHDHHHGHGHGHGKAHKH